VVVGTGLVVQSLTITPATISYTAATPASAAVPRHEFLTSAESPIVEMALTPPEAVSEPVAELEPELPKEKTKAPAAPASENAGDVFTVPFFSQFYDITPPEWKKIGCGIASLAMLINFYEPGAVTADTLLDEGIEANAYITSAGWSHAGLIGLSKKYGLSGGSRDLSGLSMDGAFTALEDALKEGPVMVSVHYTFEPTNPIPHLVVINGVHDGKVFYNDPAEKEGGNSISITKFQNSWKKRYIAIRPAA